VKETNKESEFKINVQIQMLKILCLKGRCQGDALKGILNKSIQYLIGKAKMLVTQYKEAVDKESFDKAVDLYRDAIQYFSYCSILTEDKNKEL
jgi:hypothetical protein